MSIVKQREGITRDCYCLMETVAMTAIGDLSIVKVTLTRAKCCREGVSKRKTTAKMGLLLKLKH